MYILGVSAFYHDSAAALIKSGEVIAAAQEERFSRVKFDYRFPKQAIEYCLKEGGIKIHDVDYVAYYENPNLKRWRVLFMILKSMPRSYSMFKEYFSKPEKQGIAFISRFLKNELNYTGKVIFSKHHLSHQASAFYPSPFKEAAIITMDGIGEWETLTIGIGRSNKIETLKRIVFPDSLGFLYGTFTVYCGFRFNYDEYKLMGLAPYGDPIFLDKFIKEIIDLKNDGSFILNSKYFDYDKNIFKPTKNLCQLLGSGPRDPDKPITKHYMDVAASIQKLVELIISNIAKETKHITQQSKLCLAGGVALNCVSNGMIEKSKIFDNIWIQPAAGDAGGALGAALAVFYQKFKNERVIIYPDSQKGSLLGPSYKIEEIKYFLDSSQIPYTEVSLKDLPDIIAEMIDDQKIVGLFQSRMEFGPRALGSRSVLADARSDEMQRNINFRIKNRESFRPFAPSILAEYASEYFDIEIESPYMLFTAQLKEKVRKQLTQKEIDLVGFEKLRVSRSIIPAVTHVDYSARIQTVDKNRFPFYYSVLKAFHKRTGCPVILNTSLNGKDEPILCNLEDAIIFFTSTKIDFLIMENLIISDKEGINIKSDKVSEGLGEFRKMSFMKNIYIAISFTIFLFVGILFKLSYYFRKKIYSFRKKSSYFR